MKPQHIFGKIEFWIILFLLIRLIGITNPPLEISHNWRQATGLMVARNFLETNANILYPRIDETYGRSGINSMEFPIMSYLYFLAAKILGYTHWYGRLINLIISSLGLFFFSKIVSRFFNYRIALAATLCLIGSVWFAFSRKMMPDTFCISLMFIGLYYGIRYLDRGRFLNLLAYVVITSLAVLSKIPAGIYFAIVVLLFFAKNLEGKRRITLVLSTAIPIAFTYIWYFVWNPYLSEKYGNWYNSGKPIAEGFTEIVSNMDLVLKNFYFSAFLSYVFLACFVAGLVLMIYKRDKKLIVTFSAMLLIFVIYMFKSGFYFYHHNYYIIPFVPVMALVAGYAISLVRKKWIFITLLTAGIGESIANQQHDFFIKNSELYKLELEAIADSISTKNELVAINGNGNPQQLYLAHRKGWVLYNEQLADPDFINQISNKGCKYIFVNKKEVNPELDKEIVFNNQHYIVYKLNQNEK